MLTTQPGPDPYFAYKMHHVERARTAWILSDELGIYEALRHGPATVAQVSQSTGLQSRPVAALLAASACMGVVGLESERYFIYDMMRDFVLADGRAYNPPRRPDPANDWWYRVMRQAIVTGEPVEEALPPWMQPPEARARATAHVPARQGWRILWGEALAQAFDFSAFHVVADLGGATGGVLIGLTGKCPWLRGVVVDLPHSQTAAEAAIDRDGGTGRVSFHAADFFTEPLPEGTDAVFMSHVVHDWDDARCLLLLRRCYAALPVDCPVIVQEFLLDEDHSGSYLAVFQWFGLLFGTPGDQRTGRQVAALLEQAGFRDIGCRPLDHEQSIVVGWKRA